MRVTDKITGICANNKNKDHFSIVLFEYLLDTIENVSVLDATSQSVSVVVITRFCLLMEQCGYSVDAVLDEPGGEKAFRDVADVIVKVQSEKMKALHFQITRKGVRVETKTERVLRERDETEEAINRLSDHREEDFSSWVFDKSDQIDFVFAPVDADTEKPGVVKYTFGRDGCNCKNKRLMPDRVCIHERARLAEISKRGVVNGAQRSLVTA